MATAVGRATWVLPVLLCSMTAAAQGEAKPEAKSAPAAAKPEVRPVEASKRTDIMRLLQLTQAGAMGELAVQQIIATFRQMMPQVKDELWQELKKEISAEELLLRLVPVYDKHFSSSELKELIRFYESPIGKKTTQMMPAINQEAMQIGQQWGSEVSVRIKRRIDASAPATPNPAPSTTPTKK
jgi:hypothetical protein